MRLLSQIQACGILLIIALSNVHAQLGSFVTFTRSLATVKTTYPTLAPVVDSLSSAATNLNNLLTPTSNSSKDIYDERVIFTVSTGSKSVIWDHTSATLSSLGCDISGKFAIFTHGFLGNGSDWIPVMNENFLKYRGGCVIYLDWGEFAWNINYLQVREVHWPKVSALLTRKLKQMEAEGIDPAKIFLYGHSLGARMVVDAALNFGPNKIGMIDACDPAGPLFTIFDATVDVKQAAKNVQTIHTSADFGSLKTSSHQDFMMGQCGVVQIGANLLLEACLALNSCPSNTTGGISHNMCNYMYNFAFTESYEVRTVFTCPVARPATAFPTGYKMGYDESRSPAVQGVMAVPTGLRSPWVVA